MAEKKRKERGDETASTRLRGERSDIRQRPIGQHDRFTKRKEIPADLFDDMELPAAPSPGAPRSRRISPKTPGTGMRPITPHKRVEEKVRRPGEMVAGARRAAKPISPGLIRGADLFQKGAALPSLGQFAGYDILGRLAIGGMAEILLARKPGEDRPVVIKKILTQFDRDHQFVDMFLDEARVGMQLDHPNIARFLDAGDDGGLYYIAMEWVNGVTLGRLIRRARRDNNLPAPILCEIFRKVADALHYAHTSRDADGKVMGLVHRDVSPHNIMIGYDGSVKLLDFGIAKAMGALHSTAAGVVKGKFAYMSPEQCDGADIDFRSDIFSMGIVLFEALAGQRLFKRKTDRATAIAITREAAPMLFSVRPSAPRELNAICATALAKKPGARFPTAAAMRDVLALYIEGTREDVSVEQIANFVQQTFVEELASGPTVDSFVVLGSEYTAPSTPPSASYSERSAAPSTRDTPVSGPRPTRKPPRMSMPLPDGQETASNEAISSPSALAGNELGRDTHVDSPPPMAKADMDSWFDGVSEQVSAFDVEQEVEKKSRASIPLMDVTQGSNPNNAAGLARDTDDVSPKTKEREALATPAPVTAGDETLAKPKSKKTLFVVATLLALAAVGVALAFFVLR